MEQLPVPMVPRQAHCPAPHGMAGKGVLWAAQSPPLPPGLRMDSGQTVTLAKGPFGLLEF